MVDEITGQNQILMVPGACGHITDRNIEKAKPVIARSAIILLQLEVSPDANWKVMDIARQNGVKIVLNPAPAREIPDDMLAKADILTPNEVEASVLSGVKVVTLDDAKLAADALQKKGARDIVITLGGKGVYVRSRGKEIRISARDVEAVDTTGAGDAFNGALVTALAEGKDLFEAAAFGNAAGALAVTKKGRCGGDAALAGY